MKKFTSMLAELSDMLGSKLAIPSSSAEIDALDDKKDDQVGGMELPSDEEITDLDNTEPDLSKLTLDQIIAALLAMKAAQEGPVDMGGATVEPHSDFADVDPNAAPDCVNPADNRMPDDGQLDDQQIPSLPGLRPSAEDEQMIARKPSFDDEDAPDDATQDPKGPAFDGFDTDPDDEGLDSLDGEDDLDAGAPEGEQDVPQEDTERMGSIRAVRGAHLVYKRQDTDGTFSELWIYNTGDDIRATLEIKNAIVAGTDIADGKLRSEDGKQSYELVTMGNAQMLKIDGLPN